ncbi:MAG: hypothetical protein V3S15_06500 [Woeseiaceae bacterium]
MTHSETELKEAVTAAFHSAEDAPPFDRVWRAAEERYRLSRRRYRSIVGIAAAAAVAVIVLNFQALHQDEMQFIEVAELLGSTSWVSPSDVLLPQRHNDLYEGLPVLIESTEPAGGALL